jgi:hypothetical protein
MDDVQNEEENNFCLLANFDTNEVTQALSLSIGCELTPSSRIKVCLQVNKKDPKIGVKLSYSKKKGISLKIAVKHDPLERPIKLSLGYDHPKPRSFQDYRNGLVTGAAVKARPWYMGSSYPKKLLETNKHLRAGAVTQALAAYKTVCTNARLHGTRGKLRTLFQKKKHASWSMNLSRECISKTT